MVPWCNGSTSDFLSENEGSTPLGTNFWRDGREAECGSMLSCYSGNAIGGSNPSLSAFLVRSSNGKDNWFSSSQQEFDSPTNLIWKRVITGSRPDLKSGVPQGIERSSRSVSAIWRISSMVEQLAFNQLATGSSPVWPTKRNQ